ncbi:hypothetical protein ABI59_12550 [Acidobacteria bacterium Mor1]|nr:hypothetical protein ABI59_12550 [Acidobacteria bacterium Mor1]
MPPPGSHLRRIPMVTRAPRYQAVLLDAGGTLVGPRGSYGAVYAAALAAVGIDRPAEDFERAIRKTMVAMESEIPPGVDRFRHFPGGEAEFWLRFARRALGETVGEPVDGTVAMAALEHLRGAFRRREAWEVFPDVRPALDALRELGLRLAVVSNWDSRLPEVLELLELAPYFETVAVSHTEGVEKPAPGLFHVALERLGVPADAAIHVGDREDQDVAGARAAGVEVLLLDRRADQDAGDRISDLSGLVRHVQATR